MRNTEADRVVLETNAFVTEDSASLMQLVELFETGAENIYLVDDDGRYRWRAAQKGRSKIIFREGIGFHMLMYPLEPIVYVDEINQVNLSSLMEISEYAFTRNIGTNEFPIVNSGGRIVRVIRTVNARSEFELAWESLAKDIVLGQFNCKKVYISSRKNPHIEKFLSIYGNELQIIDMSPSNMTEAFSDEGILLYESDIFPECRKLNIKSLFENCQREVIIRNYSINCLLDNDWVSLKIEENVVLSKLLRYFDDYYQAVHFEDDKGIYQGSLSLLRMREVFGGGGVTVSTLENLGISYVEDESSRKRAWADKLLGSNIHEAVFLKDNQIVSNGVYWLGGVKDLSERNLMFRHRSYWNLISDDVAREFFGSNCRILLSSEGGTIAGFKERFGEYYDIEIFDGTQMNAYLAGEFDWLIFEAGVWPFGKTKVCQGRRLYVDLLSESLRRYWQYKGIYYYACDVEEHPKGIVERLTNERTSSEKPSSASAWQGLREDYVFHADYDGDEFIRVIGQHRIDAPRMNHYTRTVWVAGPCIAFGDNAPYGQTIEAILQERLNEAGLSWRVMNCGSFGTNDVVFSDFNSLNYLMDLPMHKGDIVVHFTQYLWKSDLHFSIKNFFKTSDAFDDPKHIEGKYWHDMCAAHMNKFGYEVWAEFLCEKLVADLKDDEINSTMDSKLVKPYSYLLDDSRRVKNEHLKSYLRELQCHRHDVRGAIVMNANPFTLGHLHLVEEARKAVDFLYVFVVEEDKSDIAFYDRFAMVKENCDGMVNVEVLPSGQYMISTLTFADYFQKESKQEEKVLPTKDIKLFAEAVAPALGITKRFVGEEPFDKVTRQYNEAMKDIFPDYGIELVEIPRLESKDGVPINATLVRKWIHDGNFKECEKFLPLKSLNYLRKCDRYIFNHI